MSFLAAVATVVPALRVMGSGWLLAIMISVCPAVESWFKVGTTSSELEDDSLIGRSSAIQGSERDGTVEGENPNFLLVLLLGGKVSVMRMVNMIMSDDGPSV